MCVCVCVCVYECVCMSVCVCVWGGGEGGDRGTSFVSHTIKSLGMSMPPLCYLHNYFSFIC